MKIILDSCLLLAFLRKEKNWQSVKKYLQEANNKKHKIYFSWLNLVEIYYKVYREKGQITADKTISIVKKLPLEIILPDEDLYLETGKVKGKYAIALVDCFVVALAKRFKAIVLTGDREFSKAEKEVKISWLKA